MRNRNLLFAVTFSAALLTACADHVTAPASTIKAGTMLSARDAGSSPGNPSKNKSCNTKAAEVSNAGNINEKNSCSTSPSFIIDANNSVPWGENLLVYSAAPDGVLTFVTYDPEPSYGVTYNVSMPPDDNVLGATSPFAAFFGFGNVTADGRQCTDFFGDGHTWLCSITKSGTVIVLTGIE